MIPTAMIELNKPDTTLKQSPGKQTVRAIGSVTRTFDAVCIECVLRFLAHAAPVSTSQDRATEQAIGFLMAHRTGRRAKLQTAVDGAIRR